MLGCESINAILISMSLDHQELEIDKKKKALIFIVLL